MRRQMGVGKEYGEMKTEYFDSVWDAIEPSKAEAANMLVHFQQLFGMDLASK
jgi:predicted XRE-type DNA-binding protein